MKAITICEPYATLIARGDKRVENRTWRTNYTGSLLIHAGKSKAYCDLEELEMFEIEAAELTFGAAIAVAELVGCVPILGIRSGQFADRWPWLNDHDHTEGPFCFVLQNVRRLKQPIPWSGCMGLWDVPDSLLAEVIQ
jgi:hypothetical protein